ncbi:MFS transporter [Umezawaea beigongshangensis]|uniref:MFS transporter n=1 Tax=Umezawaea beigongshangensis TaxID=2780383 RepID=UPI0018F11F4D|nr:MFS transporter [Umezawaea beigongshangensis]
MLNEEITRPSRTPGGFTTASAFLMFAALGAVTAALGAAVPVLRQGLGGDSAVALLVGIYNSGALAATLLGGAAPYATRTRAGGTVLVAAAVGGLVGTALAPTSTLLLACAAVAGFGYGGLVLTLNTAFSTRYGQRGVVMVNALNAAFGVGAVAGPLAVGSALGPATVFLLLAAVVAVAAGAAGLVPTAPPRGEPGPSAAPGERATPGQRTVVTFAVLGSLYAGLETSSAAWLSTHLVAQEWDPTAAAQLTSLFWVGLATGRLVIPRLARAAPTALVVGCLVGAAVALALTAWPGGAPVAITVAGFCLAPVLPTALAHLGTTGRPQRATAVVLTACMVGNATVPLVVGLLITRAAVPVPLVLAGLAVCCTAVAVVAHRTTRTGH